MTPDWDDLRYFLAVCRNRSFVATAAQIKVTHSTVSRRISALESALQTQLFLRTEKGCRLTAAGELLLPFAEQLETTMINLEESVSGRDRELSGIVRVGAPDGLGHSFLADPLSRFQSSHPKLEIELLAVPMYYSLSKREIDILITVKRPTTDHIVTRKITDYRLGLFASKTYLQGRLPIMCWEDLSRHNLIGYIEDLLYDDNLRFLDEFAPRLKTNFRSSTVVVQFNATCAGAGIGVIPYFMAHMDRNLVPVLPDYSFDREFWLQVNPDSRQLARVRTTIDFIVSQVQNRKEIFLNLPAVHNT